MTHSHETCPHTHTHNLLGMGLNPSPPSLPAGSLALLLQPRYFTPLLVGMSLMLFQQITGQPSVLYYAGSIFQEAGFTTAQEATGACVGGLA